MDQLFILLITYKSYVMSYFSKPYISIILSEKKPVFSSGCHHPIRLMVFLGYQIIDQHAYIRLGTAENNLVPSRDLHGGIYTSHKSLNSRLLITGGSIKLPACVKAGYLLKLQCWFKLKGINTVIFNGIGIPYNLNTLQSRHSSVHCILYIFRQGTAHSTQVHFTGIKSFRLHKHLMAVLVRKLYHLILNGRTVPWSGSLNGS